MLYAVEWKGRCRDDGRIQQRLFIEQEMKSRNTCVLFMRHRETSFAVRKNQKAGAWCAQHANDGIGLRLFVCCHAGDVADYNISMHVGLTAWFMFHYVTIP